MEELKGRQIVKVDRRDEITMTIPSELWWDVLNEISLMIPVEWAGVEGVPMDEIFMDACPNLYSLYYQLLLKVEDRASGRA